MKTTVHVCCSIAMALGASWSWKAQWGFSKHAQVKTIQNYGSVNEHVHDKIMAFNTTSSAAATTTTTRTITTVSKKTPVRNSTTVKPTNKIVPKLTLPKTYRICRVSPSPQVGTPPIQMQGNMLPVWYQCAGKPYDDFMYQVYGWIQQNSNQTHKTNNQWGRRQFIIPKQIQSPTHQQTTQINNNNKTKTKSQKKQRGRKILIMGNSHTRQVASVRPTMHRFHGGFIHDPSFCCVSRIQAFVGTTLSISTRYQEKS